MHDQAGPGACGRHAVVVGGGIGGLLAGLVLRRRFERVTIVERDRSSERPAPRRGAPQGRCLHMLMAEGLRVIEALVPGSSAQLERAGAVPFDVGAEAALRLPAGWLPRVPGSGITMLACSRELLEHTLRARVRAVPGLRLVEGRTVRGLRAEGGRVIGVRVDGGEPPPGGEPVDEAAELTVVATGARSALARWWAALGLPPVPRTVVEARHHYVSRWFEIPAGFDDGWKLLSITPAPGVPWGGAIFAAEGGRWGMVLLVPRQEPVPTSDAELLGACERLVDRRLYDALASARPLSPIVRHEHTDSRLEHFERVAGWPEGLVIVGDAVCMLDPYFGLGMTACARGIAALAEHRFGEPTACHRFQQRLAVLDDAPWRLVTAGTLADEPGDAYYRRSLLHLAPRSPELTRVLLRRMHLLDPPDALERPEVVALVKELLARSARERAN
jgi:2-polyprenyl-6-methoxyphenol hydroxylase-like FAD-dependent oxidoreductase